MSPSNGNRILNPSVLPAIQESSLNTTIINDTNTKPSARLYRENPQEPIKGDPLKSAQLFQQPKTPEDYVEDDFKYI